MCKRFFASIFLFILPILACNAPIVADRPTIAPPPTLAPIQLGTAVPTADGALAPTATLADGQTNPLPTFTPRSGGSGGSSGGLAPTATLPAVETATPTPHTDGPLAFSYAIEWQLDPGNAGQAIATITIDARGGGGDYTYFRDEQPVEGPIIRYRWATCAGNPGSLRVTAANGESVKQDYYSNPPCP